MNKIDGNLPATGGHTVAISMRLAANKVQFACDWPPRMLFLHATGGHPDTICLRLAARRTLFLYRLAASYILSHTQKIYVCSGRIEISPPIPRWRWNEFLKMIKIVLLDAIFFPHFYYPLHL
jgi:hypothetical protein